jgi:hypothetical protein
MDLFQLQLKQQTLSACQWLRAINGFLDEHKLAQYMVNDSQVCLWIVFIRLHDLCTGRLHGGQARQRGDSLSVIFLRTLFEKDLPQDVFLLIVSVVVLDIVVVRLVEDAVGVVVAVRVLVPDPLNLVQLCRRVLVQIWTDSTLSVWVLCL